MRNIALKSTNNGKNLSLSNVGKKKATDISVRIEFPDQIRIFEIEKIKNMKEPKALKKPRDLNEVAYEGMNRSAIVLQRIQNQFDMPIPRMVDLDALSRYIPVNPNIYENVEVVDNILMIETNRGLLHTKSDSFDSIYVVALEKGKFKAKVSLMCAEFVEPVNIEITFVCE